MDITTAFCTRRCIIHQQKLARPRVITIHNTYVAVPTLALDNDLRGGTQHNVGCETCETPGKCCHFFCIIARSPAVSWATAVSSLCRFTIHPSLPTSSLGVRVVGFLCENNGKPKKRPKKLPRTGTVLNFKKTGDGGRAGTGEASNYRTPLGVGINGSRGVPELFPTPSKPK